MKKTELIFSLIVILAFTYQSCGNNHDSELGQSSTLTKDGSSSSAKPGSKLAIKGRFWESAWVENVELVESKKVSQPSPRSAYEDQHLIVSLAIVLVHNVCVTVKDIMTLNDQTSLESQVSPTDSYFTVTVSRIPNCNNLSSMKRETFYADLDFIISQRTLGSSEPFREFPAIDAGERKPYFSFDAGPDLGKARWRMYQLDYSNSDKVSWKFKRFYSYVQGKVVPATNP